MKAFKSSTKNQQLIFHSKDSKKTECKRYNDNSNIHQSSLENKSDEEYYNFSDSSLELFDSFKPRLPEKNLKKKAKYGVVFDQTDLTKMNSEPQFVKKKDSLSNFDSLFIDYISETSSSESFKSTKSVLSESNNVNCNQSYGKHISKLEPSVVNIEENNCFEFKNDYYTPKGKNIPTKHFSESAKLLDRIYGKEWRRVDGVIKNVNKNKFNNDLFENDSGSDHEEIENSFSCEIPRSKCISNNDVENAVNDTSIILEKFNLFDNSDPKNSKNSTQCNSNECVNVESNNIKQITKSEISKKDSNIKKKDLKPNKLSKIPVKACTESKLSFLSSLSCFTGSLKCDPEAEKYKLKFKKNKDELVAVLFKMFNDEVFDSQLPTNMNFKWNARLRSTAGACFNKRTVKINANLDCERVSRIELSSKIIDTAERLRDTLIHELCHAACWIFNGISEGHGPYWKSWANKAMQKYPELPIIKRCHSYDVQTKFTYKCTKCGYSFGRHSKSLNLAAKRCGYCYGEFELIVNKINKNPLPNNNLPKIYTDPLNELYNLNDVQTKPQLPKKPSKFALFVKENYGKVKRENPLSKHGEIMKLLGSRFATTKALTPDEIFDKLIDS